MDYAALAAQMAGQQAPASNVTSILGGKSEQSKCKLWLNVLMANGTVGEDGKPGLTNIGGFALENYDPKGWSSDKKRFISNFAAAAKELEPGERKQIPTGGIIVLELNHWDPNAQPAETDRTRSIDGVFAGLLGQK